MASRYLLVRRIEFLETIVQQLSVDRIKMKEDIIILNSKFKHSNFENLNSSMPSKKVVQSSVTPTSEAQNVNVKWEPVEPVYISKHKRKRASRASAISKKADQTKSE